jgi:hypothetical protein
MEPREIPVRMTVAPSKTPPSAVRTVISNVPLLSANAYPLLSLVVTICKKQQECDKGDGLRESFKKKKTEASVNNKERSVKPCHKSAHGFIDSITSTADVKNSLRSFFGFMSCTDGAQEDQRWPSCESPPPEEVSSGLLWVLTSTRCAA